MKSWNTFKYDKRETWMSALVIDKAINSIMEMLYGLS
jgi:hypothetical protein